MTRRGCGCCGSGPQEGCCTESNACLYNTDSIENLFIDLGSKTLTQNGASVWRNAPTSYCEFNVPVVDSVLGNATLIARRENDAIFTDDTWVFEYPSGTNVGRVQGEYGCDLENTDILSSSTSDRIGQFDVVSSGLCAPPDPCRDDTRTGVIITISGLVDCVDTNEFGSCKCNSGVTRNFSQFNGAYVFPFLPQDSPFDLSSEFDEMFGLINLPQACLQTSNPTACVDDDFGLRIQGSVFCNSRFIGGSFVEVMHTSFTMSIHLRSQAGSSPYSGTFSVTNAFTDDEDFGAANGFLRSCCESPSSGACGSDEQFPNVNVKFTTT